MGLKRHERRLHTSIAGIFAPFGFRGPSHVCPQLLLHEDLNQRGVAGIASSYLLAMTEQIGLVVGAGQQSEIGTSCGVVRRLRRDWVYAIWFCITYAGIVALALQTRARRGSWQEKSKKKKVKRKEWEAANVRIVMNGFIATDSPRVSFGVCFNVLML